MTTIKAIITLVSSLFFTAVLARPDCPQSCTINTYGSNWNYANLRANACNNRRPLATLYDGNVVYNLNKNKFGCGYWYTQVLSPDYKVGWVASQFLDCGGNPPVPAAAVAANNPTAVL